ncbi:hypothetical protein BJ878DRAFT_540463 [Calycina marina]|uniref:Myb-like domain-containing protein n=1 Tax=Calycina marina TaxID=1763456 RepID=A0A9P8CGH8_9HELO|nr:hypothetical protein BJ878DRAFT_540463 [Calycina marina]
MSENEFNAWSVPRPVATTTNGTWNHSRGDIKDIEKIPTNTLTSEQLHPGTPGTPRSFSSQTFSYQKVPTYEYATQNHHTTHGGNFPDQHTYNTSRENMSYYEAKNPMLDDYYAWNAKQRNGSFAEFTSTKGGARNASGSSFTGSDSVPCASTMSLDHSQISTGHSSDNIRKYEVTNDTGLRNPYSAVDPTFDAYTSIPRAGQNPMVKSLWYPETAGISPHQYQDYYGIAGMHDSLPREELPQEHTCTQQDFINTWNIASEMGTGWPTQPHSVQPGTISPKALTLHATSMTPSSSTESLNDYLLSVPDLSVGTSSGEDEPIVSQTMTSRKPRMVQPRHGSTTTSARSQEMCSGVASNSHMDHTLAGQESLDASQATFHYQTKPTSSVSSEEQHEHQHHTFHSGLYKHLEQKPTNWSEKNSWENTPRTAQAILGRDAKDRFLVNSKLAGMSYKDIRRQGCFTEAESTLRGRFRTLTKAKSARVRKPEWNKDDVKLLKTAVERLTPPSDNSHSRVPWKQVAEYIAKKGGSYHFGNATCRKKWDELRGDISDV